MIETRVSPNIIKNTLIVQDKNEVYTKVVSIKNVKTNTIVIEEVKEISTKVVE
jgi:hypothetical protein